MRTKYDKKRCLICKLLRSICEIYEFYSVTQNASCAFYFMTNLT